MRHGCTVLTRNWRANPGEVDIIAECHDPEPVLAFVEVRTRHGRSGLAEESISKRKAASMVSAAYAYMEAQGIDPEAVLWRVDLIAISMSGQSVTSINWVRGALDQDLL